MTREQLAELAEMRRENRVLREERDILKRATAFFARETLVSVFPFIEAEKLQRRKVVKACELLEISRSAFYIWHQHCA